MNSPKPKTSHRIKPLLLALAAGFLMVFAVSAYGPATGANAAANESNQAKAQAQAKAKAKARADKAKARADKAKAKAEKARAKAEKAKAKRAAACADERAADKRGYKYKRVNGVCKVVCKGKEVHANAQGTDCVCRQGFERPNANPGERRCIKSCPAGQVRYKARCLGAEEAANEQAADERERTRAQLPEDLRPEPYTKKELNEQKKIAEQVQKEPPTASAAASKSYYEKKSYEIATDYWHRVASGSQCPYSPKTLRTPRIEYVRLTNSLFDINVPLPDPNKKPVSYADNTLARAWVGGYPECRIAFNKLHFKKVNRSNATLYCNVMVHEVGHLWGFGHSFNQKDIMYYAAPDKKIKRCNNL